VRVISIFSNACQYAIRILDYFVVPEPQYLVALSLQGSCSLFISLLLLCVLATIQLNNQLFVWATEVNNIASKRVLTSKLFTLQLTRPQT